MPNPSSDIITLFIVSPDSAPIEVSCSSIHLQLADDRRGRGGGAYGIRPGHEKAILALSRGSLTAFLNGMLVYSGSCSEGFARIENNRVTVVTECIVSQSI